MRRLAMLLLAGALGWSSGGMAEESEQAEAAVTAEAIKATGTTETTETSDATERWSVCTDSSVLLGQLLPIAARIAARVAQDSADVLVNVVPQDEGSAEFLLASTSEVFAQLRNVLVARRVPYRRVNFQWRSASGSVAEIEPSPCRGVAVVVEVTVGGS